MFLIPTSKYWLISHVKQQTINKQPTSPESNGINPNPETKQPTRLNIGTPQDPCQNKPDQDQEKLPPLTTIVSDHFCLTSHCPPLAWRHRGRPLQVSHGRVSDGSSVRLMTGSSTSRRIDNESTMKCKSNQIPITRWVLDLRSRRSP